MSRPRDPGLLSLPPVADATHTTDGVIVIGAHGELRHATASACAIVGVGDSEGLAREWGAIREALRPFLAAAAEGDGRVEVSISRGDRPSLAGDLQLLPDGARAGYAWIVRSGPHADAIGEVLQWAGSYLVLRAVSNSTTQAFRDCLNAITVNTELLSRTVDPDARRPGDGDVRKRCVRVIHQEVTRAAHSVEQFVRETLLGSTVSQRVRLAGLVDAAATLVLSTAIDRRVAVQIEGLDAVADVVGKVEKLRLALLLVAVHALEGMPDGGRLSFAVSTDGPEAVVTVGHTGPPVPPQLQSMLWSPFVSSAPGRPGVSLYVARRIALDHGGSLTLDAGDSGVRFSLRLPLAER